MKRVCVATLAATVALVLSAVPAVASESEILKRLDQLEQEIRSLRAENTQLKQQLSGDRQAIQQQNQQLQQIVEQDRREIEELKQSAGSLHGSGLQAVMGKFDVQLYGRVKVDLNYDTAEMSRYGDFVGFVDAGNSGNDSTNFNPRDSRFGLKVAHRQGSWLSEARFEIDFYGTNVSNNLIPRMRLGYVKLTNDDWKTSLLIGQDWIPVASLNPPMIEFGILTSSGNLWWRVPQVTLRKQMGDFEVLASVMKHRRQSYDEQDRVPWMLGRIAYSNGLLGKGGLLAIGGGWRPTKVSATDTATGIRVSNSIDRWMMALEFRMQFGKFTFMAEPWIGNGLDNEFVRYGLGVNPNFADPTSNLDGIRAVGGWASLSYAMNKKLNFSIGYGIDDPRDSDMRGMNLARAFTRNETYFVNCWYSLTNAVKVGVEVLHIQTERNSDEKDGMRYTFSTVYNF